MLQGGGGGGSDDEYDDPEWQREYREVAGVNSGSTGSEHTGSEAFMDAQWSASPARSSQPDIVHAVESVMMAE